MGAGAASHSLEKHYVFVIHGTWNAPTEGETKWYQSGGTFADALDKRLSGGPLDSAVWRSSKELSTIDFSWSGGNTHADRVAAATNLSQELFAVRRKDPHARIHLVAHSHGGNVVLKAIELYFGALRQEALRIALRLSKKLDTLTSDAALDEVFREEFGKRANEFLRIADHTLNRDDYKYYWDKAVKAQPFPVEKWLKGLRAFVEASDKHGEHQEPVRSSGAGDNTSADDTFSQTPEPLSDSSEWFLYRYLSTKWALPPQSHRIGRVVTLGTPFFIKAWQPLSLISSALTRSFAALGMLIITALIFYVVVMAFAIPLSPWVHFIGPNPFAWPNWVFWTAAVPVILLTLLAWVIGETRRNSNFYCEPNDTPWGGFGSAATEKAPKLQALVISAGQLDEALLALSTEPLLHAYMMPTVRELVLPKLRWRFPERPIGTDQNDLTGGTRRLWNYFMQLVMNIVRAPLVVLWWVFGGAIVRFLGKQLRRIVTAKGSGLPASEFAGAHLSVTNRIRVPEIFDEGEPYVSVRPTPP